MELITIDGRYLDSAFKEELHKVLPEAKKSLERLLEGTCQGADFLGWYGWPRRHGFALLEEIEEMKAGMALPYDVVVVIGIGGSFAGTWAVRDALGHQYGDFLSSYHGTLNRPRILFAGNNLSESSLVELIDVLDKKTPILNVVSKSGTTTEPALAFRVLKKYMEDRFGVEASRDRIIVTTDSESGVMRELAKHSEYRTFPIPKDVGGRYSVLTAVGLVPLTLAGFDTRGLLSGADAMFQSLNGDLLAEHPILYTAAARYVAWQQGKRIDGLAYSEPKLGAFVEWWKQLFGESEGKENKGLFPCGLLYSTDLHSLGQYLQEGFPQIFETFLYIEDSVSASRLGVERRLRIPRLEGGVSDGFSCVQGRFISEINQAAMDSARMAHSQRGVPCLALRIPQLDEYYLGALFAFFETVCAVSADLSGVNAFDQPGVEDYKKHLFDLIGYKKN